MTFFELPDTQNRYWQLGTFFGLLALAIIYISISIWYKQKYAQFTSKPESIKSLLTIRNHDLSTQLGPLKRNVTSVCGNRSNVPYNLIASNANSMVNWRPLTVRLAGYLGGIYTPRDGVFDMETGIQHALDRGARAFVFDIDYLEKSPCKAVLIHRDSIGYMRSLHTGSIRDGCRRLANSAFNENKDPVLIILYFRRIPPGQKQRQMFFGSVATSLRPLSSFHLGPTDNGNYIRCQKENELFRTSITNYQEKFIVLSNYDTSQIDSTVNALDNLHWWTNARIYQDPSGLDESMNKVTPPASASTVPSVKIGSITQLLNIGSSAIDAYRENTRGIFTIALSNIEYSFTVSEMDTLLNTLGIQCVPIDVIRLSEKPEYSQSINLANRNRANTVDDLARSGNPKDVLSFWSYSGWSRKLNPVFIIPEPGIANRASPSTNSNGGTLAIG